MRQNSYLWTLIKGTALVCVFFMLLAIMYQTNNYEKRVLKLEERVENMLSSGTNDEKETPQGEERDYLNPEAQNLLEEDAFYSVRQGASNDGEAFFPLYSEDKGYNPLLETSAYVMKDKEYVLCSFGRRKWDDKNVWTTELAQRAELVGNKDFIVYLKKGVKWHQPTVDFSNPKYEWLKGDHFVTAKDVKFSFDILMNPQAETASHRQAYNQLKQVEVIDDYTVKFVWEKPLFFSKDRTLNFFILPEFLYAYDEDGARFPDETMGLKFNSHWYNDRMIGCGPYRFALHESSVKIVLERNEEYNLGPKPPLKRVHFLFVQDPQTQYLKLQSGELDLIELLEESIYRDNIINENPDSPFKKGELKYKVYPRPTYYYIGWNMLKAPFNDKKVRQAMTYAFDREGVLKNLFMSLGEITTGDMLPGTPEYNKRIKPYPFDLQKAGALLAQAGWKDTDGDGILDKTIDGNKSSFEFDITFLSSIPIYRTMYSIYKENLLKIGVKMNMQALDWATYLKKLDDKDYDAFHGAWSHEPDTDPYQLWHSSQAIEPKGSNRVGFKNQEADKLIEKIRDTFDIEERIKLFHKFHEILNEEQPYTFLVARSGVCAYRSELKNVMPKTFTPQLLSFPMDKDQKK